MQPSERERVVGGRYHVERVLGEGGMGVVHRARDAATGAWVALKQLRGGTSAELEALFEREYRTLASLRHPRIVRVFDFGADDAGAFYTMELLEGGDLSRRAPMPWREVCACLRDAASILGVLHARRLVHRDLNPRNLWRTPDGRLKLLDFGAVAPFGPATEIVGTPAFVAPEVLEGRPLDPRSDLFALGALGYWLLTSTHAFRAGSFDALPALWKTPPAAPSSLARLVDGASHDVPPALDRLILSLVRLDADERPRSTADLVDALHAIAGLPHEPEEVIVEGYLESSLFVGRAHERDRFATALARARLGQPHALVAEGPEGIGRTRLLAELGTSARIAGAVVLCTRASGSGRPYEAVRALARDLLIALPREASAAAEPHREVLATFIEELRDPGPARPSLGSDATEERARKQTALAAWFLTVAERRTLVVMVDDLHAADEPSQAFLATLARAEPGHRLVVIGALSTDASDTAQATLRGFRAIARALALDPLTAAELRELLRSMFGEVRHLDRLAARLHKVCDGSPSHAMMLARHLVRMGAIRYAEGAWLLPAELPQGLPGTLRASVLAALESLTGEARVLARRASVPDHGPLSHAMLVALGGSDAQIATLIEQRLVRALDGGYQLAHPALAAALQGELSLSERAQAHRVLAAQLDAHDDLLSATRAGLHWLRAGERGEGEARLSRVARRILAGEHEQITGIAPMFAEALALTAGRAEAARIPLLNVLAVAGYLVDRAYAVRFGDDALEALQAALCFPLAHRLRPYVGARLALLLALLASLASGLVRRRSASVIELVTWLVTVTGYLMGPASLCLDRARLRRYAEVLAPLRALGADHGVSQVHGFCIGLGLTLEDACAAAPRALAPVIARLERPEPIAALPERNRRNLLASALYALGLRETFACDPRLVETAETLAAFSAMHAMQADQLLWLYHSHRGELELAAGHEQRIELEAIQQGTAWQAELLMPRHQARIALWTHDAASNRRAARALARLAAELPSFEVYARRAQAVDLVLRGELDAAIALLALEDAPLARLGWTSMRALLASVHAARGDHAEARAVCVDALSRLSEDDLRYVMMTLPVEVELALAEAALGARAEAEAKLDALLARHADKGLLVRGLLHRACVRVALEARDFERAASHLDAVEACYRPTRLPSLYLLAAELRAELRRAQRPELADEAALHEDDGHLLTRVKLLMTSRRADNDDRAEIALNVALDLTGADRGFLVYPDQTTCAVSVGTPPSEALVAWAHARLVAAGGNDEHTELLDESTTAQELDVHITEGVHHRVAILRRLDAGHDRAVAALALGAAAGAPSPPTSAVLRVIGERL
ncbi:MAG: serine/threonine-protein kinase [Polyangiales bacterium]